MLNLTRRWPFGLTHKSWPDAAVAVVLALFVLLFLDAWISQSVQAWPDVWRAPFAFITDFGLSDWVLIPTLLVFVLAFAVARLPVRRYRAALHEMGLLAAFIFIGVGLPGLVSNLAKRVIGRARPDHFQDFGAFHFQPYSDWSFQSFPSGHSTTAMATAFVLGFMSPRWFRLILPIALMTGLSRVVVGMHYPTDVVAGFLLGIFGAYGVRNGFASRRWLFTARSDGSVRFRGLPHLRRLLKRRAYRAAA